MENTRESNFFSKLIENNEFIVRRFSLEIYLNEASKLFEKSTLVDNSREINESIYEKLEQTYKVLDGKLRSLWENPIKDRENLLKEGHWLYFELRDVMKEFCGYARALDPNFGKGHLKKGPKYRAR